MNYPTEWWSKPFDPYTNSRIYLSDGGSTYSWAFTGDPSLIIPYEDWNKLPKTDFNSGPIPFVISESKQSQAMDKQNDKLIHGL
jgi:hypothetical protein